MEKLNYIFIENKKNIIKIKIKIVTFLLKVLFIAENQQSYYMKIPSKFKLKLINLLLSKKTQLPNRCII